MNYWQNPQHLMRWLMCKLDFSIVLKLFHTLLNIIHMFAETCKKLMMSS